MHNNLLAYRLLSIFSAGLLFTFGCSKKDLEPAQSAGISSVQQAPQADATVRLRAKNYIIIASGDQLPSDIEGQTKSANGVMTGLIRATGVATAASDDPNFGVNAAKIAGVRSVVHDFTYQGVDLQKERTIEAASDNVNPPSTGDSNPLFPLQWGATAIHAPKAWNTGALGEGVLVADLDTGFELMHPDLQPNIASSYSFVPGEDAQFSGTGFSHGAHTAGTIAAADNGIGVIGIAPKAKLLLVKVLCDAGSGSFSWLMSGTVYAAQHNASVVNISLCTALPRNGKYLDDDGMVINDTKATQELLVALNKMTAYATKQGVTLIAAAGNDANNGNQDQSLVHIPADATGVISISATGPLGWAKAPLTTNLDRFASYSNYGTPAVAFAAPGGDFSYYYTSPTETATIIGITRPVWVFDLVLSTGRITNGKAGYTWAAGTSMAAPHTSGVAALITGKNGVHMDPTRVEAVLRASADDLGKPGRDAYYDGRVNASRVVSQAL